MGWHKSEFCLDLKICMDYLCVKPTSNRCPLNNTEKGCCVLIFYLHHLHYQTVAMKHKVPFNDK